MSLVSGWFPVASIALAVVLVALCGPWEQRVRTRVALLSVVVAAVVSAAVVGIVIGGSLLPWPTPWSFDIWFGGVVLAVTVVAVSWRYVRRRRWIGPLAVAASLLAAATLVNADYGYFPTLSSIVARPLDDTSAQTLTTDRDHHLALHHGLLVEVDIPGTRSHFHARDAWVWLPPVWVDHPGAPLPAVELLAGSPGDTLDWIRGGQAAVTADAYARSHDGVAPVLVMPDDNGSTTADSECVNGPAGQVETYLTVDVPAYLRTTFTVATTPGSLAVAGLSEGGTCAAVLALRHPQEYRAFGDYSGLAAPSVVDKVDPAATTEALFHGSAAQYAAHDPATLMRLHRYPGLGAWFEAGTDDPPVDRGQEQLVPVARACGADVTSVMVPGAGHDFPLWAQSFRQSLPFLVEHLDLVRSV